MEMGRACQEKEAEDLLKSHPKAPLKEAAQVPLKKAGQATAEEKQKAMIRYFV